MDEQLLQTGVRAENTTISEALQKAFDKLRAALALAKLH